MSLQSLVMNIVLKIILAGLFLSLAISMVSENGWSFLPFINILLASHDIFQSIQLIRAYQRIKNL
ncbi:hypothetical protein ACX3VT_00930 [Aerococcus sanguinicola]|uniref:hypothetical protein n=1 Tax=unclassified Aerococcus TaxID=2618060 RepID=UPI0008A16619|nr:MULTISPECIES: hypothetical protein [unclassified Aerococcus]KAB0646216.1 hypothetical protein F6I01_07910 [Aerococcus sanguinicola]MDK6234094.1 hypothetical protein [Aerococcus sp. UMB10185]MDK6856276.1 hypothetical protein [Aerococcus sp. UMB7533]MDK8503231.1 hypothetical protein [Aerococcus sp. UMB1112A]OFN01081.1 hypothetical protein HMPREF2626_02835 [Aerococcus sp. HMSC062A02]